LPRVKLSPAQDEHFPRSICAAAILLNQNQCIAPIPLLHPFSIVRIHIVLPFLFTKSALDSLIVVYLDNRTETMLAWHKQ
jgi:hypothetical protein